VCRPQYARRWTWGGDTTGRRLFNVEVRDAGAVRDRPRHGGPRRREPSDDRRARRLQGVRLQQRLVPVPIDGDARIARRPVPLPRAPSLEPAPHGRGALLCLCAALRSEIAPGVRRGAGGAEMLAVEVAARVGDRGAAVMAHYTPNYGASQQIKRRDNPQQIPFVILAMY